MADGKIKRTIFLAVTLAVIANLLLANNVLAKKLEISDKDFSRIKSGLNIVKIAANIAVSDAKLKTILNLALKGGQTGADITYGLLVLSSLNEMEFIDSVLTQKYKAEATAYFNNLLNEQLSLRNYYQGVGFDIPRVITGNITSPMAALTLNTFEISSKAIQIFSAMQVLKRAMIYNGLFVYFDFRKGNETHQEAWDMAKTQMGIAVNSIGFHKAKERQKDNFQLESQFASLYEKWGPYVEINRGIKEEFREQAKEEWGQTIVSVAETLPLAEEKQEPPLLERVKLVFIKAGSVFKQEIAVLNKKIQQLASFGGAQVSQISETQKEILTKEIEKGIVELEQKIIKKEEIKEEEIKGVSESKPTEKLLEELIEVKPQSAPEEIDDILIEVKPQLDNEARPEEQKFCEKTAGGSALQNKVIFNKIAWMGTEESENNEWFELKNISGSEVDLAGWQILDKDRQIKIVFPDGSRTPINSLFLLERTDDDSLPERKADLIYKGALNNTDEALYLFDSNCQLQDEVLANPDWPDAKKISSPPPIFNYGVPSPPPASEPAAETSLKILITEIQIDGLQTDDDFIELYNPNDSDIDIFGFQLKKKNSSGNESSVRVFPEGAKISAKSYFLWANTDYASTVLADVSSSQTLAKNNSANLLDKDKNIINEVTWGDLGKNQTWARKWSETSGYSSDFEIGEPTPKAQNKQKLNQAPTAAFGFLLKDYYNGDNIIFDASSSTDSDGTTTAFYWDFGDNATAATSSLAQATTSYSFATTGDFLITLIVKDDKDATSSATSSISILKKETSSLAVMISEIAWAGTKAGSSDEWLELFNNSTGTVDLAGWTLKAADGSPSITFASSTGTTTIAAQGYFLLERTNASTTDVSQDYIFTGALNNDGEKMELRDSQNNLIDLVDFSLGWPAGSSTPSYISMERISATGTATSSNWASNNLIARNGKDAGGNKINGTPRAKNSVSKTETEIFSWPFYYLTSEFSQFSLTYLGSPYLIQESLIVYASNTLKIEPGVVLKFKDSKEMEIKGNLEVLGGPTESEKIVFMRSATSTPPNDRYKIIFSNSSNSKIENAKFLDGGRLTYFPFYAPGGLISPVLEIATSQIYIKNSLFSQAFPKAVWLINSTATIDNVEISDTKDSADFKATVALLIEGGQAEVKNSRFKRNTIGIEVTAGASSTISGNNFEDNEKPIYLFENSYYPIFSNNSAKNNQVNGISLYGTSVVTDTVWESNLPYVVENAKSIVSWATLTLKEGTVVKLRKNNETFNVWGKLLIQGTATNPAVITSFLDDEYGGDTNNDGTSTLPAKGSWFTLAFNSSSTSVLDNALIRYGAGYCQWGVCFGAITQYSGSSLEIKNSRIEKNVWGIVSREVDCPNTFQKIKLENTAFSGNDINIHSGYDAQCQPQ